LFGKKESWEELPRRRIKEGRKKTIKMDPLKCTGGLAEVPKDTEQANKQKKSGSFKRGYRKKQKKKKEPGDEGLNPSRSTKKNLKRKKTLKKLKRKRKGGRGRQRENFQEHDFSHVQPIK